MAKLLTGTRIYGTGTVDTQLFVNGTEQAISTTTGALEVIGGVGIGGNLYVGGTSVLAGVQASNIVASGTLGVTATSTLRVVNATSATFSGTLGVTGTSVLNGVQLTNIVASGTLGVTGTSTLAGLTLVTNTTSATSITTGALVVNGGVGIGQDLRVGGVIYGTFNGAVTGTATNAINISGGTAGQVPYQTGPGITSFYGPGTAGNVLVSNGTSAPTYNNTLTLTGTTAATSTATGALQVRGGAGVGGAIWANAVIAVNTISNGVNFANFVARPDGTTSSQRTGVSFYGTFFNFPSDIGQRRTADIVSGFATGTWGTEYLSFNVGNGGSPNDAALLTIEQVRITTTTTSVLAATVSVSTLTGALVVAGGVGIGRSLFVQESIVQVGGTYSTLAATYNLINTTATTVNFAGAATTLNVGATSGSTNVRNNLIISGNLTVQGTTTIVDSTVTNIADPIITLGGGSGNNNPTTDDNKDRGVAFKWVNNGGTTSTGFFGYDDSTGFLTYIQTATITNEVVSGTKGAVDANLAGGTAMSLVYQSAANTTEFLAAGSSGFILQTNGTSAAPTWVSSAGIGAGSATNSDAIRTIERTTNASHFLTFVDSNNATNAYESLYTTSSFVVNPQSGNVGIGTSSPAAKLDLYNAADAGSAANGIRVQRPASYGQYGYLEYLVSSDVTVLGSLYTGGTAASYGQIYFRQHSNGGAIRDAMVINGSNNVGIGTSSPATKLDVAGTIGFTAGAAAGIIRRTTVNGSNGIRIQGNASDTINTDAAAGAYITVGGGVIGDTFEGNIDIVAYGGSVDANRNQIRFSNRSGANTITERMRIDKDGNVGIGTASPTHRLTVTTSTNSATTTASTIALHLFNSASDGNVSQPGRVGIGFGASSTRSAIVAGTYGNDYLDFYTTGDITTPRIRIRSTGAIAFSGTNTHGSNGFVLQSNGDAAPTWVNPSTLASAGATNADNIRTVAQTANAAYYPTFVDSNNSTAAYEPVYTTSTFSINPATGNLTVAKTALIGGSVAQGDPSATDITANATLLLSGVGGNYLSFGQKASNLAQWIQSGYSNPTTAVYPISLNPLGGNVGVGTLSPGARLEVYDSNNSTTVTAGIKVTNASATTNSAAGVVFQNYDNYGGWIRSLRSGSSAGILTFGTNNGVGVGEANVIERVRIDSVGTVGIGETSPITYATSGSLVITNTTFRPELALRTTTAVGGTTAIKLGATSSIPQGGAVISSYISAVSGQPTDLIFSLVTSGSLTERLRITSNGGIAFSGSTSYGSAGQMLQSNGDAAPTWVALSSRTVGTSSQVTTVLQTASASYFPTFVDSNNTSATAESFYTTSSFTINPQTGNVSVGGRTEGIWLGDIGNNSAYDNVKLYYTGYNGGAPQVIFQPRTTPGSGVLATAFYFKNSNGSSVASNNRADVYVDGNVGIGTVSPSGKLHLYQNAGGSNQLTLDTNFASGNAYAINPFISGISNGGFSIRDVTNSVERLVIQYSTGFIGIGTTAPNDRLHVQAQSSTAYDATNDQGQYGSGAGITVTNLDETSQSFAQINLQVSGNAGRAVGRIVAIRTASATSDLAFVTENANTKAEKMRILSNGNVSIGTTSTTNKFEVVGTAGQLFSVSDSFTGTIFSANDVSGIPSIEVLDTGLVKLAQYNGAVTIGTGTVSSSTAELSVYGMLYTAGPQGEIRASNEITAYFSSDARLKENIKLIENPITIIDQIRGVTFDWTDEHMARRGGEDGYFVRKHDIGVIAQEVQAVLPELVGTREDGYLAVKYEKLTPLLIEAIKAQQATIDSLVKDLADVKEFINQLKNNK